MQLPLPNLPHLPRMCPLPRHHPPDNLKQHPRLTLLLHLIVRRLSLHKDQRNPRVLRSTGMNPIAQITKPSFEIGSVERTNLFFVVDDLGAARDGDPGALFGVIVGDVYVGVVVEVVEFVGLVVGDEPVVEAR